jgi:hypothetical protein
MIQCETKTMGSVCKKHQLLLIHPVGRKKINKQYTKLLREQLTPQFSTPASYTEKKRRA